MKRYYMAYGSNLNIEQMAQRCPTARIIGTAKLMGYKLVFKGLQTNAYATVEPSENNIVPVLIWELKPQDEKALDRYEGFPNFYYKKTIKITINNINIEAMIYIMNNKAKLGIPSKAYYDIIRIGYKAFDFDLTVLEKAVDFSLN